MRSSPRENFRRTGAVVFIAASVGSTTQCREPAQIAPIVKTNVPWDDTLAIGIGAGEARQLAATRFTVATGERWGADGLVGSLTLVPASPDSPGTAGIRATLAIGIDPSQCRTAGADGSNPLSSQCAEATRITGYLPHRLLRLNVGLWARCFGVDCGPEMTCNKIGVCVSARVAPETCGGPEGCDVEGDDGPEVPGWDGSLPRDASLDATDAPDDRDVRDGSVSDGGAASDAGDARDGGLPITGARISGGNTFTCAVTATNGVKCWGSNASGELGNNGAPVPSPPVDVVSLSTAIGISAGDAHACALMDQGSVKCWGINGNRELGDGTTMERRAPVDVIGLSGVKTIAIGGSHGCALTHAGAVKCWGANGIGQLGDNSTAVRTTPVDVLGLSVGVKAIAVGTNHSCAITATSGVKCWGDNNSGQLGDGSYMRRQAPVDVLGLSGVLEIGARGEHTCAITATRGVKCWGDNAFGQVGDDTSGNTRPMPADVMGLTSRIESVAVGDFHTCALTTLGGVKCWGDNSSGSVGDTTTMQRRSAVDVFGLTSGVVTLTAGAGHACVLTTGGVAKCWGYNNWRQLGNGFATPAMQPSDVVGYP